MHNSGTSYYQQADPTGVTQFPLGTSSSSASSLLSLPRSEETFDSQWYEDKATPIDPEQIMHSQTFLPMANPNAHFVPMQQNQMGVWNQPTPFVSAGYSQNAPTPLMRRPILAPPHTYYNQRNTRRDSDGAEIRNREYWKQNKEKNEAKKSKKSHLERHLEDPDCEIVDGVPTYYFHEKHKEKCAKITYHDFLPRLKRSSLTDDSHQGESPFATESGIHSTSSSPCPSGTTVHSIPFNESVAERAVDAEVREMFNQLTM